jgi:hypothetical protein
MTRDTLSKKTIFEALDSIALKVYKRLEEKGSGAFAGPHECYGILAEEFAELLQALQVNDKTAFREELIDIAVGAVIGLSSNLSADTTTVQGGLSE